MKKFLTLILAVISVCLFAAPLDYIPKTATSYGQLDLVRLAKHPLGQMLFSNGDLAAKLQKFNLTIPDILGQLAFGYSPAENRIDAVAVFQKPVAQKIFDLIYRDNSGDTRMKKISVNGKTGFQDHESRLLVYDANTLVAQFQVQKNAPYTILSAAPRSAEDRKLAGSTLFAVIDVQELVSKAGELINTIPMAQPSNNIKNATLKFDTLPDNSMELTVELVHNSPEKCQETLALINMMKENMMQNPATKNMPSPETIINGAKLTVISKLRMEDIQMLMSLIQ